MRQSVKVLTAQSTQWQVVSSEGPSAAIAPPPVTRNLKVQEALGNLYPALPEGPWGHLKRKQADLGWSSQSGDPTKEAAIPLAKRFGTCVCGYMLVTLPCMRGHGD